MEQSFDMTFKIHIATLREHVNVIGELVAAQSRIPFLSPSSTVQVSPLPDAYVDELEAMHARAAQALADAYKAQRMLRTVNPNLNNGPNLASGGRTGLKRPMIDASKVEPLHKTGEDGFDGFSITSSPAKKRKMDKTHADTETDIEATEDGLKEFLARLMLVGQASQGDLGPHSGGVRWGPGQIDAEAPRDSRNAADDVGFDTVDIDDEVERRLAAGEARRMKNIRGEKDTAKRKRRSTGSGSSTFKRTENGDGGDSVGTSRRSRKKMRRRRSSGRSGTGA